MRSLLKTAALGIAAVGAVALMAPKASAVVTLDVGEVSVASSGSPNSFFVPITLTVPAGEAPFNLSSVDAIFDFVPDIPNSTIKLINITFDPFPPANFSTGTVPSAGSFLTTQLGMTASSPNDAVIGAGTTEIAKINLELQAGAANAVYGINILSPELGQDQGNSSQNPNVGTGSITVTPEPTGLGVLGLAAAGLLARRRRHA
jgi:hypothetical protein